MSRKCDICGRDRQVGMQVSHAHNRTKKVSMANIQRVRAVVDGRPQRMRVCTRCIRSGKVAKAS